MQIYDIVSYMKLRCDALHKDPRKSCKMLDTDPGRKFQNELLEPDRNQ